MSEATRKCRHCGEQIARDAEACPACGALYRRVPCADDPSRDAPGQCVVCGLALCDRKPDGGRAWLCAVHEQVPVVEGWAQVYSTSTDLDAELVRDNLKAEGIEARVLSQKDHFFAPVTMGDLSPVRVLVPAYEYLDARERIEAHTSEEGEVRFACPECGEPFEDGAEVCPSCGASLR